MPNATLNLHTIVMDFKAVAHNSVRRIFPQAATKDCLFHFGLCLVRNLQRLGLLGEYEIDDSPLCNWVKLLKALLPVDLVNDA